MTRYQNTSGETGIFLYVESMHGGWGGLLRDRLASALSWLPGVAGLAVRSLWLRLFIKGKGSLAVEPGVTLLGTCFMEMGEGVYIGHGSYLHGRPGGLSIGAGTRVMPGSRIHVYNFRDIPKAGIKVGADAVIGMNCVITGQGGVEIGDKVIMAPGAMVLPANHVFEDRDVPVRDQGITAEGIKIEDGAWIGAGAVILDGVKVGRNAVVGAGSVVTSDVEDGKVVAGSPAREIDTREAE